MAVMEFLKFMFSDLFIWIGFMLLFGLILNFFTELVVIIFRHFDIKRRLKIYKEIKESFEKKSKETD